MRKYIPLINFDTYTDTRVAPLSRLSFSLPAAEVNRKFDQRDR
jgi:hypothetical protein